MDGHTEGSIPARYFAHRQQCGRFPDYHVKKVRCFILQVSSNSIHHSAATELSGHGSDCVISGILQYETPDPICTTLLMKQFVEILSEPGSFIRGSVRLVIEKTVFKLSGLICPLWRTSFGRHLREVFIITPHIRLRHAQ
jgi:hypothetical protein